MRMIRYPELRGRKAFKDGHGNYANPYDPTTFEYGLWLEGWYQAKMECAK